jgi:phosphatidylglycerol lysyltransferase
MSALRLHLHSLAAWWRFRSELWGVRLLAALTALMGVVNVLSAVTPALTERLTLLEGVLPLEVRRGSRLTASLAGFALVLLAVNLWRRKRVAWMLTLGTLVVSIVTHLLKGLDYEEALLAATVALGLIALRASFHARSDPPSFRQGLWVMAAVLVFTLAYGALGFYLLDRHFRAKFDLLSALRQTVVMFTQFYDPGLVPLTRFGRYFEASIYVVGVATLTYGLFMLVRPVIVRQPARPDERARARAIVEAHGRSSLARFALFDDKSYFFSPGGSVVAFVVRGRVALALADPVGPEDDLAPTVAAFKAHCARNDWRPAFYQVPPDHLGVYKAAGFVALCVGREGVVDLANFTLAGNANKDLRTAMNRLTKLGHCTEVHPPPLGDNLLRELRTISDEWLTMMHGQELRFATGWFDDDYIRHSVVIAVHTPDGPISAFANVVPEYRRNEATVDLMRRHAHVVNGTMDFLFAAMLTWAKEQTYATFSLGLSALAGVGGHSDDPAVERALRYIYEHVNRFYNFKGLHAFKDKFRPRWEPRYLIYPGPATLPAVAAALVRIHAGEDFPWSYLRR